VLVYKQPQSSWCFWHGVTIGHQVHFLQRCGNTVFVKKLRGQNTGVEIKWRGKKLALTLCCTNLMTALETLARKKIGVTPHANIFPHIVLAYQFLQIQYGKFDWKIFGNEYAKSFFIHSFSFEFVVQVGNTNLPLFWKFNIVCCNCVLWMKADFPIICVISHTSSLLLSLYVVCCTLNLDSIQDKSFDCLFGGKICCKYLRPAIKLRHKGFKPTEALSFKCGILILPISTKKSIKQSITLKFGPSVLLLEIEILVPHTKFSSLPLYWIVAFFCTSKIFFSSHFLILWEFLSNILVIHYS